MKLFNTYFKASFLVLVLCLFSTTTLADENSAKAEVIIAYHNWCSTISSAKGDANKMLKFYAPNAILLPTLSSDILYNHRNGGMDAYFAKLTNYPNIQCTTEKLITRIYDNTAINTGLYAFSYTDRDQHKQAIPARFTFVYKDLNGQWLIIEQHSSKLP